MFSDTQLIWPWLVVIFEKIQWKCLWGSKVGADYKLWSPFLTDKIVVMQFRTSNKFLWWKYSCACKNWVTLFWLSINTASTRGQSGGGFEVRQLHCKHAFTPPKDHFFRPHTFYSINNRIIYLGLNELYYDSIRKNLIRITEFFIEYQPGEWV